MKFLTSTAIVLAAGVAAAPAAAQYGASAPPPRMPAPTAQAPAQAPATAEPQIKLSKQASKAIIELQTAVNANDAANIPAKIAAAQAVAQSKDDRYAIGELQLKAAVNSKNYPAASQAVDAIAASGFVGPQRLAELYMGVGAEFYNSKQYDQASTLFQKSVSLNPQSDEALNMLAQAYLAQGNKAQASAALQKALQMSTAAGKKPEETLYKNAVSMAYDAKSPTAVELGRQWVAAYPSAQSWHDSIAIYRNLNQPDAATEFDLLRLARLTGAMQGTGDYHAYAYAAADAANYGEAKSLMSEGIASGKIKASDPIVGEIQNALKGKPTPTEADLATAEKGAREPQAFLRVGDRYYGIGNYQKAAELYREALSKGVDKNLANLRLGEALARAGDKAGATAAFNAVSGPRADIAKFWLTYVQHSA
jgi:tetratricopeptide (TPR) repeat protein